MRRKPVAGYDEQYLPDQGYGWVEQVALMTPQAISGMGDEISMILKRPQSEREIGERDGHGVMHSLCHGWRSVFKQ